MKPYHALLLIPLLPVLIVSMLADGARIVITPDWSAPGLTRAIFKAVLGTL